LLKHYNIYFSLLKLPNKFSFFYARNVGINLGQLGAAESTNNISFPKLALVFEIKAFLSSRSGDMSENGQEPTSHMTSLTKNSQPKTKKVQDIKNFNLILRLLA